MALKVFEGKDTNTCSPKAEFELLQQLADCPYVLNALDYSEQATLALPDSLLAEIRQEYTGLAFAEKLQGPVQCMAVELCRCDLFDLISKVGAVTDHSLLCALFKQILAAVQALHNAGHSHLDLKLENILVSRDNQLRLCDLGFAQPTYKSVGRVYGTEGYMAPEIIDTDRTCNNYDGEKADIFSLGVILYIMCFGRPPFARAHTSDRFFKLRVERPGSFFRMHPTSRPSVKEGKVSEDLQDLLIRLLSPDLLQERPNSIAAILSHRFF